MQCCKKIFFRLYPNKLKPADTHQGLYLRKVLRVLTFLHVLFFFVCLTIVGFLPMLSELGLSAWCYSCYLTLKEWQVILYMLFLFIGLINGFINIFAFESVSLIFYIINLVYYGIAMYFAFMSYKNFRKSGGIHGGVSKKDRQKQQQVKEKLLEKTGEAIVDMIKDPEKALANGPGINVNVNLGGAK